MSNKDDIQYGYSSLLDQTTPVIDSSSIVPSSAILPGHRAAKSSGKHNPFGTMFNPQTESRKRGRGRPSKSDIYSCFDAQPV
jgi:hypothetical protein